MLTIENFHKKLIGKGPIGAHTKGWWVSGIEETRTQYHIFIIDKEGNAFNRINIERMPTGGKGDYEYELWWWDNGRDPLRQRPIRRMLSVRDLRLGATPLLQLIDYMLNLK